MKKTLLFTVVFISYLFTSAQTIEKNKRILGGSLSAGFNHSQADTTVSSGPSIKNNSYNISLSPSLGKAIRNDLVFGYLVSISYYHTKGEDLRLKQTGKSNGSGFGAGVFIEKFFPLSKSLSFSGIMPLQLNYNSSRSRLFENSVLLSTSTNNHYGAGLSLYPSLNFSLNKKIMLQLSLNNFISIGYSYMTSETKGQNYIPNKQSTSNFGFNSRVNHQTQLSDLGFAFRYIF